ncbi:uncharacterized protein [Oscarella lobularis]|uniref:uncharacterized protein n=1 Tax=Oscarella lobularis TaxID=121494 RepID=UPI003313599E
MRSAAAAATALLFPRRAVATFPAVGSEIVQKYRDDGYAIVRNVVGGQLLEEMKLHVDWIMAKYPQFPPEHLHHPILRGDPFWMRLCCDERLVDIATTFVGPHVALFASHYFCKMPRTGKRVLWHQDGSYWPLEPMKVISLWLAVDESTVGNGCLRVVRGSHKEVLKKLEPNGEEDNVLGSMTHVEVKEDDVVNIELNPGDVEIHDPCIVHGSEANTSDRRRCGLTIRYIASDTKVMDSDHPVYMIRGEESAGVNRYRSWPRYIAGYHMAFEGCTTWNERRKIVENDESYFDNLTPEKLESDVVSGVWKIIEGLRS